MISVLHTNLISCWVGLMLSCLYKNNFSYRYLFCAIICSVNCDYVEC